MVSRKITVTNSEGLHMRSGGIFAEKMGQFQSRVTILFKDERIDGKSIINIMLSCIKCGSQIEIECDGEDENQALAAAVHIIENELF